MLDKRPRAHVPRLLLQPHGLVAASVLLEELEQALTRKRIQLLDPNHRHVVRRGTLRVGLQFGPDVTAA